jgi:undecaprenyl-phosphate 4-deoxy-4-formamido-L-arabinose transferase
MELRTFSVSVVVPVYNSATGLGTLLHRLAPVLEAHFREYEAILVNDGSSDESWPEITELNRRYAWVRGINLMRNYGQHSALLCGIRTARHQLIITIDDDLQNPPEEIPNLLQELETGLDVVYGRPKVEQHGLLRSLASKLTKMSLESAMGIAAARNVSAFRIFRADIRKAFKHYDGPFVSIDVLLTWGTKRFGAVEVSHDERKIGVSNYTVRKLVNHAIDLITGFSALPLRIASLIGFTFTLFGTIVFGFVIWRYFVNGDSVPGFPFLASIISIFSGAQLCALGIIGEYLSRMHFRAMGLPSAVIRDQIGLDS